MTSPLSRLLFAIDPGTVHSGVIFLRGKELIKFGKVDNGAVLELIKNDTFDDISIEMIASYGMAVGQEVFETCVWIGRFMQAAHARPVPVPTRRITRREIKLHLCGTSQANDSNVRKRLVDIFGGVDVAVGNKKDPGPLYGVHLDVWSALAVGMTSLGIDS